MQLRFYGRLAEVVGPKVELDDAAGSSVARIREQLCEDHLVASSDRTEFRPLVSGG